MDKKFSFLGGLKDGLMIGLAYLIVSFSFGTIVTGFNLPIWYASLVSGTNLTSAGQFAGISLVKEAATYIEIFLTLIVINSRYFLMSIALSQQLSEKTSIWKRLCMSLFITDEIFAVAVQARERLNFKYFIGLSILPYVGWVAGSTIGAFVNSILPETLQNAVAIALYAMFIAIILPPMKKSKAIAFCVFLAITLSCALYFIPYVNQISTGFRVIIASVLASGITAFVFPIPIEKKEDKSEVSENVSDISSS